ncbi:uncharacterized protein [Antedon mediterranea]|uniref:uncharacterized protein n=1 Tax=Antedon mediterranea TaxID=105859 RepID=UPI003AF6C3F0
MHEGNHGKIQPYRVIVDPRNPLKYHETSPRSRKKQMANEDRKEQHRMNERFRHHNLNLAIKEIVKTIPYPQGEPSKNETKYNVLHRASAYMDYLKTKISLLSYELDMQSDFVGGLAVFDKPFNNTQGEKKCSVPAYTPFSNEVMEELLGHKLPVLPPICKSRHDIPGGSRMHWSTSAKASADYTYPPIMRPNIPAGFQNPDNHGVPIPLMVSKAVIAPSYVFNVLPMTSSCGVDHLKTKKRQATDVPNNIQIKSNLQDLTTTKQMSTNLSDENQSDVTNSQHYKNNPNPVSDCSSSPTSSTSSFTNTNPSFWSGSCASTQMSDEMIASQDDDLSLKSDEILLPAYDQLREDHRTHGILTQDDILTAVTAVGLPEESYNPVSVINEVILKEPFGTTEKFIPISDKKAKSMKDFSPNAVVEMSTNSSVVFDEDTDSDEDEFCINWIENDVMFTRETIPTIPLDGSGATIQLPNSIEQVLRLINGPKLSHLSTSQDSSVNSRSWINGYQLFTKINHHKFRSCWPEIEGREITRLLGKTWKDFPTEYKTLYSERACELNEYNRSQRERSIISEQKQTL